MTSVSTANTAVTVNVDCGHYSDVILLSRNVTSLMNGNDDVSAHHSLLLFYIPSNCAVLVVCRMNDISLLRYVDLTCQCVYVRDMASRHGPPLLP